MRYLTLVLFCLAPIAFAQDAPAASSSGKEHAWLKQFAGEWESVASGTMAPGQPPITCKGTISGRMLGDLWAINESKMNAMGMNVAALQTIGYNAASKKFVGTWSDTMSDHLWHYTGTLDESGKVLTLSAEGPNFFKPGVMSQYQDIYEFKSKDHYTITSKMKGDDGKWTTFMSGDVKRKK
jgi:hypothetical protein